MSEIESDDQRLRATEEQMRRALGLQQGSSSPVRVSSNAPRPQKRWFARDRDVRVELLQSHDNNHVNQLDAIREALQSQIAAREEVERLLAEARHTIHDLQTELGHERLARDEAAQQSESAKRVVEQALAAAREDLEAERALRGEAETERDMAIAGRLQAQVRHSQASSPEVPASATQQPRRRGRPPKLVPEQSELVEWWKPGWKEKYS
jgi:hypothetical protein